MKNTSRSWFTISNDIFAVVIATGYLLTYCILIQFDATLPFSIMLLLFSPAVVIWMVFVVLKYGKYKGPPLDDEEFGYQDKSKKELGTW